MARAMIKVPERLRRGEAFEIRTLIAHPMETGFRSKEGGGLVPRDIISRFVCRYNGEQVFAATLYPAITANPYIAFHTVATDSGVLEFSWTDDRGSTQTESVRIVVE